MPQHKRKTPGKPEEVVEDEEAVAEDEEEEAEKDAPPMERQKTPPQTMTEAIDAHTLETGALTLSVLYTLCDVLDTRPKADQPGEARLLWMHVEGAVLARHPGWEEMVQLCVARSVLARAMTP